MLFSFLLSFKTMIQKTTIILVFLCFSLSMSYAQKKYIPKNMVLIEVGTATWCVYCPGVAMAVDQMNTEGLDVAVIENHGNDEYETSGSLARNDFYDITAFPTGVFNGTKTIVGGGTTSCYEAYRKKYEEALLETTAFTISLNVTHTGANNYSAHIDARKIDYYDGTKTNIFLIVTQSHIPCSWMGQSEVNFVNRKMVTGDNGLEFCFDCSGNYNADFTFTIPEDWDKTHLQAVAFIQDMNTKEILNTAKDTVPEPVFWNAASIQSIEMPEDLSCLNKVTPQIKIKNDGKANLKSLKITYWINSDKKTEYNWTGDMVTDSISLVTLPELTFTPTSGVNKLNVQIDLPNNNTDELPEGNTAEYSFNQYWQKTRFLEIKTSTDFYSDETSWALLNNLGEIVLEGNNFSSGTDHYDYFEPKNHQCYTFKAYDAGGDGITEGGRIELIDYFSQQTITYFSDFGSESEINLGSNYKWAQSINMKTQFNQGVSNNDTLIVKGFAHDSIVGIGLSIYNETPVDQWLQVESQLSDGNEDLNPGFTWNENIESQHGDSLKLSGLSSYKKFMPFIRPRELADTLFVTYTVWSDSLSKIKFTIEFISLQNPPLLVKLMDAQGSYYKNNDTINYNGFSSEMNAVSTPVRIENLSSFAVKFDVIQRLSQSAGLASFDWDPSVEINAGDTNSLFKAKFNANEWVGSMTAVYTFVPKGYPDDSLTLTIIYQVNPNPNFKLLFVNGQDSSSSLSLKYELIDTLNIPMVTDFIKLLSTSYYDISVILEEKIIEGNATGIDSTYWMNHNYLGGNQLFSDTLILSPDKMKDAFVTGLFPPFTPGTYKKQYIFSNAAGIGQPSAIDITYLVTEDTSTVLTERTGISDDMKVWPNPASDFVRVELPADFTGKEINVLITDALGRIIHSRKLVSAPKIELFEINNIPKGVYLLTLFGNNQIKQSIFVKE